MGTGAPAGPWEAARELLRARGLRWTPQRRMLVEVLARSNGHVTGAELVERSRAVDPATTPSTVYRTLDVLEEVGLVRHAHGADGREEFHVLPEREHGHLHCASCGSVRELGPADVGELAKSLREAHGFEVDLSHVTIVGRCASCAAAARAGE
jgi:Fur family transcriptional regulator, ferric uptake regulator